jgi:DNA topoisomerase-1
VWPHESSLIQQKKDIEKFNKAIELRKNLVKVRKYIRKNLDDENIRRRKIATVCYLIDKLNFRVGDEKDEEEEADTVGASSLRSEHISFNNDGTVTFDFLGKDSVRHTLTTELDETVIKNLREFAETNKNSTLFHEVNSSTVSTFMDEVMEGLSAKVFRTCHTTNQVENKLKQIQVNLEDPVHKKKHAAILANLEAAIICNHKKTVSKTYENSLFNQKKRLEEKKGKARENMLKYRHRIKSTEARYKDRISKYRTKLKVDKEKLKEYKKDLKTREEKGKSTLGIKKRIQSKRKAIKNTIERIQKTKKKNIEQITKIKKQQEIRRLKDKIAIEKASLKIKAKELTREYNLGTSLKSYIDPRVYFDWGKKVDYDWRNYYNNTLEKKFSWVESTEVEEMSTCK